MYFAPRIRTETAVRRSLQFLSCVAPMLIGCGVPKPTDASTDVFLATELPTGRAIKASIVWSTELLDRQLAFAPHHFKPRQRTVTFIDAGEARTCPNTGGDGGVTRASFELASSATPGTPFVAIDGGARAPFATSTRAPSSAAIDLSQSGGTGRLALGFVIAFDDVDGDDVFDFGEPGVAPEPIIATSLGTPGLPARANEAPATLVLDLEGALPPAWGFAPPPRGVSLVTLPPGALFGPYPVDFGSAGPTPNGATIELAPAPQPSALAAFTCRRFELEARNVAEAPARDGLVTCVDRTSSWYVFERAARLPARCELALEYGVVCLDSGATLPADWPCANP